MQEFHLAPQQEAGLRGYLVIHWYLGLVLLCLHEYSVQVSEEWVLVWNFGSFILRGEGASFFLSAAPRALTEVFLHHIGASPMSSIHSTGRKCSLLSCLYEKKEIHVFHAKSDWISVCSGLYFEQNHLLSMIDVHP